MHSTQSDERQFLVVNERSLDLLAQLVQTVDSDHLVCSEHSDAVLCHVPPDALVTLKRRVHRNEDLERQDLEEIVDVGAFLQVVVANRLLVSYDLAIVNVRGVVLLENEVDDAQYVHGVLQLKPANDRFLAGGACEKQQITSMTASQIRQNDEFSIQNAGGRGSSTHISNGFFKSSSSSSQPAHNATACLEKARVLRTTVQFQ